jgi:hypothetical protein
MRMTAEETKRRLDDGHRYVEGAKDMLRRGVELLSYGLQCFEDHLRSLATMDHLDEPHKASQPSEERCASDTPMQKKA